MNDELARRITMHTNAPTGASERAAADAAPEAPFSQSRPNRAAGLVAGLASRAPARHSRSANPCRA
jgi:hypothetical protein